jgi:uncharacterized membrane protein YdbT with pleckstrin-like domain
MKRLPGVILGIVALFVIGFFFSAVPHLFGIAFLVLTLYIVGSVIEAWYVYSSHVFMLDEYALHIRFGILNRNEVAIPYRQIQDVTIDENYIERLFAVTELSVMTAGREETKKEKASAEFPLIDRALAMALQEELSKRSSVQQVTTDKDVV